MSEVLYIHSKVMIVDDRRVIVGVHFMLCVIGTNETIQMGSANFNDRSQKASSRLSPVSRVFS